MDLFGRYVFRQVAGVFLLILLTLTSIVWIATALRELDLLTAQGQTVLLFLKITGFALPNLIALIAPIALLLACLYTLDRLNGDSELVVITAAGTQLWRVAAPFLLLGSLVSLFLIVANFWLMPASLQAVRAHVMQARTDLISQVLQPGRFSSPEPLLTFHIRDRAANGDLQGLMVHDARDRRQVLSYLAKRGRIVDSQDGVFLVMQDGQIHRRDQTEPESGVQIVAFEQYIFDISQFGPDATATEIRPRERYFSELLNPDPDDHYLKNNPGQIRAEIHNRFATLLYPLMFVLVPLMVLANPTTVRQGRWRAILIAFSIAVGIRLAGLAAMNLHNLRADAVVLVYGMPLGAILVATLAAQARMTPNRWLRRTIGLSYKLNNDNFWSAWGMLTGWRGRVQ